LTEDELDFLMHKVYKTITKQSMKVHLDPFDIDCREMLTEDDICALEEGIEIESIGKEAGLFSQTCVSIVGAQITLGHARTFVENTTSQIKMLRESVSARVIEPMHAYMGGFNTAIKNDAARKQMRWVLEMNMMTKKGKANIKIKASDGSHSEIESPSESVGSEDELLSNSVMTGDLKRSKKSRRQSTLRDIH